MTGCAKTEYITKTVEVATVPPSSLYETSHIPEVPEGVLAEERTDYLLDAYAARKDAILRSNERASGMAEWVERIKALYPKTKVVPPDSVD